MHKEIRQSAVADGFAAQTQHHTAKKRASPNCVRQTPSTTSGLAHTLLFDYIIQLFQFFWKQGLT